MVCPRASSHRDALTSTPLPAAGAGCGWPAAEGAVGSWGRMVCGQGAGCRVVVDRPWGVMLLWLPVSLVAHHMRPGGGRMDGNASKISLVRAACDVAVECLSFIGIWVQEPASQGTPSTCVSSTSMAGACNMAMKIQPHACERAPSILCILAASFTSFMHASGWRATGQHLTTTAMLPSFF